MALQATYVHTSIVARDWKRLASFYEQVFGCLPLPPERDNRGQWVEQLTGVPDAAVKGLHLRLPGCGPDGPTLEIFQYNRIDDGPGPAINRPGLAHLAFQVPDVAVARQAVRQAGGQDLGQMVTVPIPGAGTITVVYVRDPEGNIIELQRWS